MLGLAEIMQALAELGVQPEAGILPALAALPQQVVSAKLLRGKGGDIMRCACCRCLPALTFSKQASGPPVIGTGVQRLG